MQAESYPRLDQLVPVLPGMFFTCGAGSEYHLADLSQGCDELVGYTPDELLANSPAYATLIEPADLLVIQQAIALLSGSFPCYEVEYRVQTRGGQQKRVLETGVGIFDQQGKVQQLTGWIRDIQDRRSAEIALLEREERLRRQNQALVQLAKEQSLYNGNLPGALQEICQVAARTLGVERVGIFLYTNDRTQIECLNLYVRHQEHHSQDIVLNAKDFPAYFKALEAERILAAADACQDSRTCEFASTYLQPLGVSSLLDAPIWVSGLMVGVVCHEHVGPNRQWLADEQQFAGAIADMVSLALEANHRQQAEDRYRHLFENAIEAFWQSTAEGHYLNVNPSHARMCGYDSPAAMVGAVKDIQHQIYVDPTKREEFLRQMQSQGFVSGFEYQIYGQDGRLLWVMENSRAVTDPQGNILYFEGSAIDITDRKQAEAELKAANQQLLEILESITSGFFSLNHAAEFTYINHRAEPLLQRPRQELLGQNLWVTLPDFRFSSFFAYYQKAIREQVTVKFEEFYPTLNRWLEVHAYPFQQGLVVYLHDVSDRKRTEAALVETKERYALAILGANDGIWDWNLLADEIYFSPRWKSMLGYADTELPNQLREWFDRIHPQDLERIKLKLNLHQQGQTQHFEEEYRIQHKNGNYRWVLGRGIALRDATGKTYRMAGSMTDVTEQRLAQDQLWYDALHDPLTQLPNRTLFMDRLQQVIRRGRRRSPYHFAVLFLDLDRFKVINDSLGHVSGDQLLVELSQRISQYLRPEDTLARLGGDEFVLLLDDLQQPEDATAVAQRIQEVMRQPFTLNGQPVFTSASIGIALNQPQHQKPEDYLRNADIAMYRSKKSSGSCYTLFSEGMHTSVLARLQLETDLRHALEQRQFCLHYQPIICLNTARLMGVEALIRWQHPQKGQICPDQFISLAEETGLIVAIGQWVLQEACQQMQTWQTHLPSESGLTISVNLSSKQLAQPDLIAEIDRILAETGLEPKQLKLEITETMILHNPEAARQTLLQLKQRQIQLSMDDFGTGYSSLSYLHRLPLDLLKIDRAFVDAMDQGEESLELLRAIISIAHSLKMQVIAEGIETQSQLEQLRILGCEYGQGYFISRPLDGDAAGAFLKQALALSPQGKSLPVCCGDPRL